MSSWLAARVDCSQRLLSIMRVRFRSGYIALGASPCVTGVAVTVTTSTLPRERPSEPKWRPSALYARETISVCELAPVSGLVLIAIRGECIHTVAHASMGLQRMLGFVDRCCSRRLLLLLSRVAEAGVAVSVHRLSLWHCMCVCTCASTCLCVCVSLSVCGNASIVVA